jgi:RNA ligase (TIGR02306 family)
MPASLAGDAAGSFPSDIPKTDAERIQNLPDYFEQYKDAEFEVSEKLDGSSCTLFRNNDKIGVCSRNWEMKESDKNTYWMVAKKILPYLCKNVALQGEVIGEGIQKNPLKIRGQKFYLFNVYDLDAHVYLNPDDRLAYFNALRRVGAELEHVPIIEPRFKVFTAYPTMEALLAYADGKSVICKGADREGLVFKPWGYGATIFKAISNVHLLKQKD